jgi:hypothetical protein
VIWRVFRKSATASPSHAWWDAARSAETAPTAEAVASLRDTLASPVTAADERERQVEMLEGLEQLVGLAGSEPAVIHTQHRVVGSDVCHMVAPACLVGITDHPGKLFLTSRRLIHVGESVRSWPWHRIGGVERTDRALEITILGAPDTVNLICNTYGDAMTAAHLARRLQA